MSTATATLNQPWSSADLASLSRGRGRLVTYWLPLLVIGVGLFASHHEFRFAANASGEQIVETDLEATVSGSNAFRQMCYLSLGGLGSLLLLRKPRLATSIDKPLLCLILAFAGFALLSVIWSDGPGLTLRRTLIPLLMMVGALGITRHWSGRDLCLFVVHLATVYILVGLAAECAYGTFMRGANYRFSGTLHPNRQALQCATLSLAAICMASQSARHKWLWLWLAAGSGVFLLLTASRSGTLSFAMALLVLWFVQAPRPKRILLVLALGFAAASGALLLAASGDVTKRIVDASRMGRELEEGEVTSLTGRIPIWIETCRDIVERPLLGHGYGAFWTGQRVRYYSYIHNWEFDHAHSVYLETLLNVGLVGLGLGLLTAAAALRCGLKGHRRTRDPVLAFVIALIVMALAHGFIDSVFVRPGFAMLLLMLAVSWLAFHGRQQQQQQEQQEQQEVVA